MKILNLDGRLVDPPHPGMEDPDRVNHGTLVGYERRKNGDPMFLVRCPTCKEEQWQARQTGPVECMNDDCDYPVFEMPKLPPVRLTGIDMSMEADFRISGNRLGPCERHVERPGTYHVYSLDNGNGWIACTECHKEWYKEAVSAGLRTETVPL